ncbi:hypothetical protein ABZ892_14960 [Streptomyces sp. NPDC046924]|uniref:hypothetical protein n=1 Tax=Streptomyces sp. NPDC046924 TaxID=3155136 RepID=UPI0033C4E772
MNVADLLKDLQSRYEQAMARADDLRRQIEHLTSALADAENRLADLAPARKIVQEITPDGIAPTPPSRPLPTSRFWTPSISTPDQPFRVRELHELLGWPTDDPP